jgi:hypothetical protein
VARLIRHPISIASTTKKGDLGGYKGLKSGMTSRHYVSSLLERPSIPDLTCGAREEPCLFFFLSTQHFLLVEGIRIRGSHIV